MSHNPSVLICSAFLALAACAPEGQAPTASTQASTNTQTATAATTGKVGLSNCSTPDGGKVHFKVGSTVMALTPPEIQETIPKNLKPPFSAEVLKAELDRQTAAGGGCPEKPLDMLVLAMNGSGEGTLLQGTIGMLATDPGRLSKGYADVTARLQANPPDTCKKLGGDLIACTGTESSGSRKTEVMYIVTTDRNKKMNSGGPLAIRCSIQKAQVRGCNIVDRGRGDFIIDAILDQGEYSTSSIEQAWKSALAQVDARRK
jgi:hypothetical protein